MIFRYSRKAMAHIWSEENKFASWLKVELAAMSALAEAGIIPAEVPQRAREKAECDPERILAIEKETHHDVAAFVDQVASCLGEDGRYFHFGLTSSDVLDTALALRLKESADLLIAGLDELLVVLRDKAYDYKDLVMVGRTHGVHAEPITMGLKFALWYAEFQRQRQRLVAARGVRRGGQAFRRGGDLCASPPGGGGRGLRPPGAAPPPSPARLSSGTATPNTSPPWPWSGPASRKWPRRSGTCSAPRCGRRRSPSGRNKRVRRLCPTSGTRCSPRISAAWPGCSGGNAVTALENVALWHERDISHSSVERLITPDSTILLDFMLARLTRVLENLVVYPTI